MFNIERLMQTGIPDIAPVYGGVSGRTMSSRHQAYAWPAIKEAGVKAIIDLREMDKSDKLPYLCQYYGTGVFPLSLRQSRQNNSTDGGTLPKIL
ncbi:MAG: hypothetical protein Q4F47_05155 [Bacteroidaceae bacterium]|nr:hypothetical protein [Bacteroidaceae bacterium]MDO5482405.1 hypothetical protein [Bacteroidaceae bacterium]